MLWATQPRTLTEVLNEPAGFLTEKILWPTFTPVSNLFPRKTDEDSVSIHPKRQELVVANEKLQLLSLTGKGFYLIPYLTKDS